MEEEISGQGGGDGITRRGLRFPPGFSDKRLRRGDVLLQSAKGQVVQGSSDLSSGVVGQGDNFSGTRMAGPHG